MRQRLWIAALIVYAAAIFLASHRPLEAGSLPFPHFDLILHAGEFALFFLLAWKATGRRLGVAWWITLLYAASDEMHQAFIVTRDASLIDLLADAVGAGLGTLWIKIYPPLWRFFRARILGRTS